VKKSKKRKSRYRLWTCKRFQKKLPYSYSMLTQQLHGRSVGGGGSGVVKQFASPQSVNNYLLHNRVIRKVMKTQHQNPEFGARF